MTVRGSSARRRGTEVAAFKVGPDYIDPGYHALATGRPGRNLDPVLVGEQRIAPLAVHGSVGAHVTVVEGVMGLFDGRSATVGHGSPECGSTAHVAALLGAPVLLVVDVRGQGRSLAALLHGFRSFDPGGLIGRVRIGGVVLNRVGSARHEQICRYPEYTELLAAAGAVVAPFDPLRDESLPPGHSRGGVARWIPRGARRGVVGQCLAACRGQGTGP